MTGWAATNTLREAIRRCPEHGIPFCSPLLNGCSRVNHNHAALALVEAALAAAADPGLFDVFDDNRRYAAEKRLAAALRAAREGA